MSRGPRVAILGAGPVGLDAALAAADRGWPFTVYEAAPRVAAHVRRWGHVQMFSPWSMNVSPRMRRRLTAAGAGVPEGDACPPGRALVERVLEPVAALPGVAPRLRLGTRVVAVGREGHLKHEAPGSEERAGRPFRLLVEDVAGRRVEHGDVVLDCTGTYGNPNAAGDGGIPAPGEETLDGHVERHLPDLHANPGRWLGAELLLVGAGHSAQTVAGHLADLARERSAAGRDAGGGEAGVRVHWVVREEPPAFDRVPDDPLPARDRVAARAEALAAEPPPWLRVHAGRVVDAFRVRDGRVEAHLRAARGAEGGASTVEVDRVLSLTGYVGDHTLYRQLQVHECYATCGPMGLAARLLESDSADCLDQESHGADVLANPEPGFFILGSKSYGRNNTFLLTVGWDQVTEVFGALEER